MIGNCYTGRVKSENGKFYICKPVKVFGNDPWEIEISEPDMTFEEMMNDEDMFVAHHLLELIYSEDELKEMNRYEIVPSNELIWIREGTHQKNKYIHKQVMKVYSSDEYKTNMSNKMKGRTFSKEHKKKLSAALTGKKLSKEHKKHLSESHKGKPRSEFGKKFKEHYGITSTDNKNLYSIEWTFWITHNKTCRWEANNE